MTSCVQLFANFKKVVKIQSFDNFWPMSAAHPFRNFLASGVR